MMKLGASLHTISPFLFEILYTVGVIKVFFLFVNYIDYIARLLSYLASHFPSFLCRLYHLKYKGHLFKRCVLCIFSRLNFFFFKSQFYFVSFMYGKPIVTFCFHFYSFLEKSHLHHPGRRLVLFSVPHSASF